MILAAVSTAVSVGSTAYGVVSSQQAAAEQRQMIAEQQDFEQRRAETQANQAREDLRRQIGLQRAQFGARGFTLDSPTAIAFGQEAERQATTDVNNIRFNGANRVRTLDAQRAQVDRDATAALVGGVGSIAGTTLSRAPTLFPGLVGAGG